MLYKNTMWKLFESLSPQEIYMKPMLYMIYMKIQDNSSSPNKMMNFKSAKSIILTQI